MLKLHGFALSNYYNMIKLALLEKGFEFEEVYARPSQEDNVLAISPMGKIPYLEADEGFLSESSAILEFLEDINAAIRMFPQDPYQRAKARELINVFEMYVDNAMRPLVAVLLGRKERDFSLDEGIRAEVGRGLAAVQRLAKFDPYMLGEDFGYVDIFAYYCLRLARKLAEQFYQWDILSEVQGMPEWYERVASRNLTKEVDLDAEQAWNSVFNQN